MCVCESGNSTGDYELVCAQRALCSQGPQDIHGTGVGHTPVSSAPRENQNPSRTTPIRADQGTSCARRASVLPPQAILDCPHPGCRGASRIRKLLDRSWKQHSQRQKHWGHVRGDDAPHRFRAPLFPFYLQSQTFELGLWSSTTQTPSALLHPPPPAHPFCLTLVPQRKAAMPWAHQDPVPLCRRRNTELRPGHQHGGRVPRPPWDSPEAEGQLVEGSSSTLCPSRHRRTGTDRRWSEPAGSARFHLSGEPQLSGEELPDPQQSWEHGGDPAPPCSARTQGSPARGRRQHQRRA